MKFVTTAGNPERYTEQLKSAGLTVFHVVPSLGAALKAVECGVDGLIVEGGEGGGFKNPRDVSTMVLLPLIRSKSMCPLSRQAGSSMAVPWQQPLPWVRKPCKWARAWCLLRNHRFMRTGKMPL